MEKAGIGVFDSGIGGLTVLQELIKILPHEDFVYFGDIAHLPYGSKSEDAIKKFAFQNAAFLIQKNIKLLVVACNTATSVALDYLKSIFSIPIIGVIEPAVDQALSEKSTRTIGIIGTSATIKSNKYKEIILQKADNISVFQKSTPLFVPLIEEGWSLHRILDDVIDEYLNEFRGKVDTLILGCTHYPIIKDRISNYFENRVKIIDSSVFTALSVKRYLDNFNFNNRKTEEGNVSIFLSDITPAFETLQDIILKKKYGFKKVVLSEYIEN